MRRLLLSLVAGAAAALLAPTAHAAEPYAEPDNAEALRELLLAQWPNPFSHAEQALPSDSPIRAALWRARVAARALPGLPRGGDIPVDRDGAFRLRMRVARTNAATGQPIDVRYVEFGVSPGPTTFAAAAATAASPWVYGGLWRYFPGPLGSFYPPDYPQFDVWYFYIRHDSGPGDLVYAARDIGACRWTTLWPPPNTYNCYEGGTNQIERESAWAEYLTQQPIGTVRWNGRYCEPNYSSRWFPPDPVRCLTRVARHREFEFGLNWHYFDLYGGQPVDRSSSYPVPPLDIPAGLAALAEADEEDPSAGIVAWVNARLAPDPPALLSPPSLPPDLRVGEPVVPTPASWGSGTAVTVTRTWRRCVAETGACFDVRDAATPYVPSLLDVGLCLEVLERAVNAGGEASASARACVVRPRDTEEHRLALRFRPQLFFDSAEPLRPLSVNYLLAETGHRACELELGFGECTSAGMPLFEACWEYSECGSSVTAPLLPRFRVLDLDDERRFDTGFGAGSVVYYNVARHGALDYLDYWIFYRHNDGPVPGFDHEGDWEGVVVAFERDAPWTPSYVTFAQHEGRPARYLIGNADFAGTHVRAYVARGSHASYPAPCFDDCSQAGATRAWRPEGRFDGAAPWSWNGDEACDELCALPIPDATHDPSFSPVASGWASWRGAWGASDAPESPGWQERYQAPWRDRPILALLARDSSATEPSDCVSWIGHGVNAVACDPGVLARSVEEGEFDRDGEASVSLRGVARGSESAPGIAQLLGRPLVVGDAVDVRGRLSADGVLLLKLAADEGEPALAELPGSELGLAPGGERVVVVRRDAEGRRIARVNQRPTCNTAVASPARLWPPDRRFVRVAVANVSDPDGDPVTLEIGHVSADEAIGGDVVHEGGDAVRLRAWRNGGGDGRVYRLAFTASDGYEACDGVVTVAVPHDRR